MLNLNFEPFPLIDTERLILRKSDLGDAEAIFALRTDEKVLKYTNIPQCKSIDDAAAYIERILKMQDNGECIMWYIALKSDSTLIGNICFWNIVPQNYRAEIGYTLLSAYHGQGFMQEAIVPIINYGFNAMKLHSIEAKPSPYNLSSLKLLERNNFVKEAHFKENYFKGGQFLDTLVYSLLNS